MKALLYRPYKARKAQIFSTDLLIGMSIALLLLGIVASSLYVFSLKLEQKTDYNELTLKALQLSDLLAEDMGDPTSWETGADTSNINSLGLADKRNIISTEKWAAFTNKSSSSIKGIWNTKLYDFRLRLKYPNGTVISTKGSLDANKPIVTIQRIVLYGGSERIFEFSLQE